MAKNFEDKLDLNESLSEGVEISKTYKNRTPHSDFPEKIDELKEIEFSSTDLNSVKKDLTRYYKLLSDYVSGELTFEADKEEFNSLNLKLSKYNLTSKDYTILRDSIIELIEYVDEVEKDVLYGESGAHQNLKKSIADLNDRTNKLIDEINENYNVLIDGVDGKLLPKNSIGIELLDKKMSELFLFLETNHSIYIDRSKGEAINAPSKNTIVIKIKE